MIVKYPNSTKTLFRSTVLNALLVTTLFSAGSARAFDSSSQDLLDPTSDSDRRVFATLIGSDSIYEYDLTAKTILNSFPAPVPFNGSESQGLAYDRTALYFLSDDSDLAVTDSIALHTLDPDTGEVIRACTIPGDPGSQYDGLGVLDDEVYLLDAPNNSITVVDPFCNRIRSLDFADSNPDMTLLSGGLSGDGGRGVLIGAATDGSGNHNLVQIDPIDGEAAPLFTLPLDTFLGAAVLPEGRLALSGFFFDGYPLKEYDRFGNDFGSLDLFEVPFSSLGGDYPFEEIANPPEKLVVDITRGKGNKAKYILVTILSGSNPSIDPTKDVLRGRWGHPDNPKIGDPSLKDKDGNPIMTSVYRSRGGDIDKDGTQDLILEFILKDMKADGSINSATKELTMKAKLSIDGSTVDAEGTDTLAAKGGGGKVKESK